MFRKILRCFGRWLRAMYFVVLIVWLIALAVSTVSPLRATVTHWPPGFRPSPYSLFSSDLEDAIYSLRLDGAALSFSGVAVAAELPVYSADGVRVDHPTTLAVSGAENSRSISLVASWWVVTLVLLLPLIIVPLLKWCLSRKSEFPVTASRPRAAAALCVHLIVAVCLWLMMIVGALACFDGDSTQIELAIGDGLGESNSFALAHMAERRLHVFAMDDSRWTWQLSGSGGSAPEIYTFMGIESISAAGFCEIRIPLWLAFAALAMLPVINLAWFVLRHPPIPPGCCPKCGYDLRGSPGKCPECGAAPRGAATAG